MLRAWKYETYRVSECLARCKWVLVFLFKLFRISFCTHSTCFDCFMIWMNTKTHVTKLLWTYVKINYYLDKYIRACKTSTYFCMKSLHNRWQLTICRRTVFPSTSSVRIFYNKIIVSPMNHLLLFVWRCWCKSACCISLNRIELLLTKSTPIVLIYVSVKHSSWKINCTWIILLTLLHTTAA